MGAPTCAPLAAIRYFILNLADGDRDRTVTLLQRKRWAVGRDERHRDALAPGDPAFIFAGRTLEFVGHAKIVTAFLDPMPSDSTASDPAQSGVLLDDVEAWTSTVPLAVAVQRIDPDASNAYVQANAAGFRAGVVEITVKEYDIVVAVHKEVLR